MNHLPYETEIPASRERHLRERYGVTVDEFNAKLRAQDYECAVCHADFGPDNPGFFDHLHACCPGRKSCGKCLRDVLCRGCNVSLGNVQDNATTLLGLIQYLTRWETRHGDL